MIESEGQDSAAQLEAELARARERERQILAALPDMLFWLNGQGEVLDFRVPDELLLVPRAEVKGWRVTQPPMPSVAGQGWLVAIQRCLRTCEPQCFRYELPLASGTRQQEVRFAYLGEDRVLAMARDLTSEHRRAERSHQEVVLQNERILASLNDFIWAAWLDNEGRIRPRYFSSVVERVTGFAPEHFLETADRYFEMVVPEDREQMFRALPRFVSGELAEIEISYRIRRPDGEMRWLNDRVRAERVGDELLLTGVATDITDARRVEERLRETQKLEELGSLAGGIAHDFNNLLVGMLGGSELACESLPEDHPARRPLEAITDSAARAADLCRQMLAYAGKGHTELDTVDLRALMDEMSSLLHASVGRAAELGITLTDAACPVRADASQLRQLVINLLSNAADAVTHAGGHVQLSVEQRELSAADIQSAQVGQHSPPGRYAVLRVTDDGAGMDNEVLRRIFQPFFTTKTDGHGLGMPAVLGIVRSHAGLLWVDSTPGKGSIVEVALPLTQPKIEAVASPLPSPMAGGAQAVLVVDDEDTVLMVAGAVLESVGYDVITAPSGPEGVARFRELGDRVAAVVLDMTMPGMSGAEVLHQIRELDAQVPVIVSSGFSEADARGELSGENLSFLAKPYRAKQLREAVAKVAR